VPRLRVQRLWPHKTQRSPEGIRLNIHIIMNKFVIVIVFFLFFDSIPHVIPNIMKVIATQISNH